MPTTITPLVADDRQAWAELYRGYARFYKMPMTDDILNRVWDWLQDDTVNLHGLAARDDATKQLIGIAHYRQEFSPLRGSRVGFLDDLYVSPDQRGRNIARQFFEALQAEAKTRGWLFVRWRTAPSNATARRAYAKVAHQTDWLTYQLNTPQ